MKQIITNLQICFLFFFPALHLRIVGDDEKLLSFCFLFYFEANEERTSVCSYPTGMAGASEWFVRSQLRLYAGIWKDSWAETRN